MVKGILIGSMATALLVLLLLGVRDIHRFDSNTAVTASNQNGQVGAPPSSGAAGSTGATPQRISTIRFVKNPAPVPPFSVRDIDGHIISSAKWRGKVLLVNFWATWCPPCRAEIPDLIKLQSKYQGKLQIIGFSDDTGSIQNVKDFVRRVGINYPVAIASPKLEAKFGGVVGLPTSFVVDTRGRVVQKHVGLHNPALYDTEIRALLQLPIRARVETFTDNGQIFLSNAKNATELPGIDLSKLTPAQKRAALRQLNQQRCACGCNLTLAQCRINDPPCRTSQGMAQHVVDQIAGSSRKGRSEKSRIRRQKSVSS